MTLASKYNELEPYLASSINKYGADEDMEIIQIYEAVILEKLDYCLCKFSLVNAWIEMKKSILEEDISPNFKNYILACVIKLLTVDEDDLVTQRTCGNVIEALMETLRKTHISSKSLMDEFLLQYYMTFKKHNILMEKLIFRHFFPHKQQID